MSGIVGAYRVDGAPVATALLDRMLAASAHRGGDGEGRFADGPLALGHRLLFTTPESLDERQPAARGSRRLVWDGRLDNRDDLLVALGATAGGGATDPDLVLAAHERWGDGAVARLVGDFAFALWDGGSRTLLCARDRLGLRPLHYAWDGACLLFASDVTPLLAAMQRLPPPDDEMVVAFLLREFRDADHARSFFSGIRRLPPGHRLVVRGASAHVEPYAAFDLEREIRYEREAAYAEHFLALFTEAVRARTRSAFPVGALLSGGLDSAAVVSVAARGRDPLAPAPPLEAFTVFGDDAATDERPYVRAVTAAAGVKGYEVAVPSADPEQGLEGLIAEVASPVVGPGAASVEVSTEAVLGWGCRVLLTGEGGDQLLDEVGYLGDLLRTARLARFVRETRRFAAWHRSGFAPFARAAAALLAPPALRYGVKRLTGGAPPAWINPDLARRIGLADRLRAPRQGAPFRSLAQAGSHLAVAGPWYVVKLEVDERCAAARRLDVRYPFLDSRLVEFVLAVPWHRRTREGERKRLLRSAMAGIVPDLVRERRGKGDWTDPMDRGLGALCRATAPARLVNRSGLMDRYVDERAAARLVARYAAGATGLRWEVWSLLTLDRWLARFWGTP